MTRRRGASAPALRNGDRRMPRSAWVAGLASAPHAWRGVLTGVALGRALPTHAPQASDRCNGASTAYAGRGPTETPSPSTVECAAADGRGRTDQATLMPHLLVDSAATSTRCRRFAPRSTAGRYGRISRSPARPRTGMTAYSGARARSPLRSPPAPVLRACSRTRPDRSVAATERPGMYAVRALRRAGARRSCTSRCRSARLWSPNDGALDEAPDSARPSPPARVRRPGDTAASAGSDRRSGRVPDPGARARGWLVYVTP